MRITSKGQVTIPQAIREKAGLLPHTEVEFHYVRGQVVLKPISKPLVAGEEAISPIRAAIRRARGSANEPMFKSWSTDHIMAFLRGYV